MIAITNFQEYKNKRIKQKVNKSQGTKERAVYLFMTSTMDLSKHLLRLQIKIEDECSSMRQFTKLSEQRTQIINHIQKMFKDVFGHDMIQEDKNDH